MSENLAGNREYKDNIFRMLFGDANKSAELYNAIMGTNYAPDALKMNMLQNPLFSGLRNDISFTVDDKFVVLIEHQASVNPNMGLRCLLYITQIYERLVDKDGLYKAKAMSIENPEFIVMYNGKDDYPEKSVVKLSDLYKVKDGSEPKLEVIVTVYNINAGYNRDMMKRSRTLDEYAAFVSKVRSFIEGKGYERTEALNKAVVECVREGVLQEFLEKYGGDVMSILSREFNLDDFIRVRVEEEVEDIMEKAVVEAAEAKGEKIAENLIKRGTSLEFIVEDTGLPLERIQQIYEAMQKS